MATSLSQTPATDYRLGFQSLDEEVAVETLPVQGELPEWLTGSLIRVTPALLEVGDRRVDHWFDGLAMLNRFGFDSGSVSYKSRFIESRAYEAAKKGEVRGAWLRNRSVPLDLQARAVDLLARLHRQPEREPDSGRRTATSR